MYRIAPTVRCVLLKGANKTNNKHNSQIHFNMCAFEYFSAC